MRFPRARPRSFWSRFVRPLRGPLIYILLFALAFDIGTWVYEGAEEWPLQALVIALVLLLNSGLGVVQEYRSEQALARLGSLTAPQAWVLRGGVLVHLPSTEVVPGDVIRIEAGERVSADGTLLEGLEREMALGGVALGPDGSAVQRHPGLPQMVLNWREIDRSWVEFVVGLCLYGAR